MIGRWTAIVLAAGVLAACDDWPIARVNDLSGADFSADLSAACPNDQVDTCPSPAPTYGGDGGVAQIIQTYCVPCHNPNGAAFDRLYETYSEVNAQRGPMLDQVNMCNMPPVDAAVPLPERARKELVIWFNCGAPND